MKKPISHFRQLNDSSLKVKETPPSDHFTEEFVSEQLEENGVLVTHQTIKRVDVNKRFEGIKCSDFNLQNIVAAGAVDLLKPIAPLAGSSLESVEQAVGKLNEFVNNAESLKNNQND